MSSNKSELLSISNIKIFNNFDIDTLLISYKTFKKFLCAREHHIIKYIIFFDENKNYKERNYLLKLNQNEKYINKIILDQEYLCFSRSEELYLFKGENNFSKSKNILSPCFNKLTRQLIILDNKDIVAHEGKDKISFYIHKDSKYEKFFNNINKYGLILGLCKLDNNEYCFLSRFKEDELILSKFYEDFTSQEKELKNIEFNKNTLNNIIFKINKNYVVIIGSSHFVLFNIEHFEIVTIIETDTIYSSLNITLKNQEKEEYEYLGLITEKEKIFYFQMFKFEENSIQKSTKINLNECSLEIKNFIEEDKIEFEKDENSSKDKPNDNKPIVNMPNYFFMNVLFFEKFKIDEFNGKEISFDLNYDIITNGKIVIIMGINSFFINKRLVVLFDINLDEINFN